MCVLVTRGSCVVAHYFNAPFFGNNVGAVFGGCRGGGQGVGAMLLAEYKGQKLKYNDLVDVIVGTSVGVKAKKTEPIKARFKTEVMTVRGLEFECRPLVSSERGPRPQYSRNCVFKVTAFGACVLGTRRTRYFSDLKPRQKERRTFFILLYVKLSPSFEVLFVLAGLWQWHMKSYIQA